MKKVVHSTALFLALGLLSLPGCRSKEATLTPTATQTPTFTPVPTHTATPTPLPTPTLTTGTGGMPWWNERVFYEVFVRSFFDSDGDGIGDLQGLVARLDYLNDGDPTSGDDLGVTGVWLMPVAESPSYHGYDVVDYWQVEQDYGTNADLRQFIAEAHRRGIVVIVDLVLNHTSNQHPWFLDAQTPGSEHETWYIWRTERPLYLGPWGQPVWHQADGRYYYGVFWEGMPDLNYENEVVTDVMYDVAHFWLQDMGVDGFRLDAIKHLIEDGRVQENTPATHAWLEGLHRFVRSVTPDALIVGEAWTETAEVIKYIGDEIDVAFEFDLAQAILDSISKGDSQALVAAQAQVLKLYPQGQYAVFLTNHDQNRVMAQLKNDPGAAKVAATLLLTNPGVPFIYYGEEIGMWGVKPDERIRTPMQWDGGETAGFTSGVPWEDLARDHETANVAVQDSEPDSLLNHYRQLIRLRQAHPALRVGDMALVDGDTRQVYSFVRHTSEETLLVVVNLSDEPLSAYALTLESGPLSGTPFDQAHGTPGATLLLGEGQPVAPTPNAAGGFDAYTPLPELAPRGSFVIRLGP
jgi:alpha-amylase